MDNKIFNTADILLPTNCDMRAFSVVACDQYTSEPAYWSAVKAQTEGKPSALNLIFPEIYLKTADFEQTIADINRSMADYLAQGVFTEHKDSLIYIERVIGNGKVRKGIVGAVDLEHYDYAVGAQTTIRATEGTVLDRIPPRVKIREDAPLELPHVMLLIDDKARTVVEPLAAVKSEKPAYDVTLMQQSGSIKGWILNTEAVAQVDHALQKLADKSGFNARYGVSNMEVLLFAVGDGNHSLATARKCYMNLKERIGEAAAMVHPARYALVEVVNLHDDSLEFEAIHRVVFNVDADKLMGALAQRYKLGDTPCEGAQMLTVVNGDTVKTQYILNPQLNLAVGSLQEFLDSYLKANGGEVDYIHGEEVVKSLCTEHKNSIGFILPSMDKQDLFKTVILDGALPRKTFSMGEACDKRFYLEARKIR